MRRAVYPLSIVALGVLTFLAWMHPAVLWPTNVGWLLEGDDRGQSAIGLLAYLRAGDGWLHEPLLSAPQGLALLFTDSIPLLGLVLAPVANLLPPAQFIGLWYLACCLLQALFAGLLVRRYTTEPVALFAGAALLTLFPVLLNRYGHASLCAQWLLLWSQWIFIEPRRADRPWWWAAAMAVAALIHSYLLLMVAAFWASAVLAQLWRGVRARVLAGAVLAIAPAVMLMIGHGALAGPYASTGTYGEFPAALDLWWNPANADFTALPISSPAMPEGRGFEGFGYLGAGLLLLAALAVARAATARILLPERDLLRRLAWLLPAFGVLAMLAIGPAPVWRGQALFVLPLPAALADALDPVRASGRLLWPATYTLAFAAVAMAARTSRATLLLGVALAVQLIDLTPMITAVRATSARADGSRMFTRTPDPRWTALIAQAGTIQFEPTKPFRNLQLMEEVGWRAVVACRPIRAVYASREAVATRSRIDADARDFRSGRLDPSRLYILLDDSPAPPLVGRQVRVLDGVRIIPPSRAAPPINCGTGLPSAF